MAYKFTNTEISKMSFLELGKKLSSGELTQRRLKDYYVGQRKKAVDRNRRLQGLKGFGEIKDKKFPTYKEVSKDPSKLLKSIVDVSQFNRSEASTKTGLKKRRSVQIDIFQSMGFDVDVSNYDSFVRFWNWLQSAEIAKFLSSKDPIATRIFEEAGEGATEEDWNALFREYMESEQRGGIEEYK